jgi:hypothetical protein
MTPVVSCFSSLRDPSMLADLLRPLIRLLVGFIAVPLFRLFVRHAIREKKLGDELIRDLELWFRGSILLFLATRNFELMLLTWVNNRTELPIEDLKSDFGWISMGMRLLLAIGVIQSMPDQDLFSIIHVGSFKLSLPAGQRFSAFRQQFIPLVKSVICRHIDRSSAVFAILAVVLPPGRAVWICYTVAIVQFLIIGLVSSRDKALDVLATIDDQIHKRRLELDRENRLTRQMESALKLDSPATGKPNPLGSSEIPSNPDGPVDIPWPPGIS